MSARDMELSEVMVMMLKRIVALEYTVNELKVSHPHEAQFVSAEQIDEITERVETNFTRKLQKRMERAE